MARNTNPLWRTLAIERAKKMTEWEWIGNTLIYYNHEYAEIDFNLLYHASNFNFAHDIYGIVKAVKDRDRYFLPRCAVQ